MSLQTLHSAFTSATSPTIGLSRVLEGQEPLVLAQLLKTLNEVEGKELDIIHICRDDQRLDALKEGLSFFAPDVKVLPFPAWDCVPYDRAGPKPEIIAQRMARVQVAPIKIPSNIQDATPMSGATISQGR